MYKCLKCDVDVCKMLYMFSGFYSNLMLVTKIYHNFRCPCSFSPSYNVHAQSIGTQKICLVLRQIRYCNHEKVEKLSVLRQKTLSYKMRIVHNRCIMILE